MIYVANVSINSLLATGMKMMMLMMTMMPATSMKMMSKSKSKSKSLHVIYVANVTIYSLLPGSFHDDDVDEDDYG